MGETDRDTSRGHQSRKQHISPPTKKHLFDELLESTAVEVKAPALASRLETLDIAHLRQLAQKLLLICEELIRSISGYSTTFSDRFSLV